jgi:hypothetical protein
MKRAWLVLIFLVCSGCGPNRQELEDAFTGVLKLQGQTNQAHNALVKEVRKLKAQVRFLRAKR